MGYVVHVFALIRSLCINRGMSYLRSLYNNGVMCVCMLMEVCCHIDSVIVHKLDVFKSAFDKWGGGVVLCRWGGGGSVM